MKVRVPLVFGETRIPRHKPSITRALRARALLARSAPKHKIPNSKIIFLDFPGLFATSALRAARRHYPGAQRAQ